MESYAVRVRVATVLVVLIALFSLARLIQDDPYGKIKPSEYGQRFAAIKAAIPSGETVGYISNWGPLQVTRPAMDDPDAKDNIRHFFMTRYAMTPLRVVFGTDANYVIGDFDETRPLDDVEQTCGLTLVRDYGGGVMLFRTQNP